MAAQLSRQRIVARDVLREVGEARLAEARVLFEYRHYTGAVYLAGYSVECYLKHAVCVTLGWDALRGMFKTHDLEGLMLYSGLESRLHQNARVRENFVKIIDLWQTDGVENIRYRQPGEFDEVTARLFLECVEGPTTGFVTWLKKTVSK